MKQKKYTFKFFVENSNLPFLSKLAEFFKQNKVLSRCIAHIFLNKTKGGGYLRLSCNFDEKPIVKRLIIDCFAQCFVEYFKFNYLNKKVNLEHFLDDKKNSIVQTLTYYDINIDKQLIFNALKNFENILFVESFFTFNLNHLEKRWDELISLANENSLYFSDNQTFLELLKFLISNLESIYENIELDYLDGVNILYDNKILNLSNDLSELDTAIKLLPIIPKHIKIRHIDKFPPSLLNLLCFLFENRIDI